MKPDIQLAIVIPFFKLDYFEEVLKSLVNQTVTKFNVYIGNDCSKDSPLKLIDNYKNQLQLTYKEYKNNLGLNDLVAQWHRCLDLVESEEWVWFLPDDDIPSSNVVEEFYKGIVYQSKYNIKVFRMGLKIINKNKEIMRINNLHAPKIEDNLSFYKRVASGEDSSTLGDNIFNKQCLLNSGGFVNFPKAWGSDHATILQTASGGKIYFLSKAFLRFRMSGNNISSETSDGLLKLNARIEFVNWLKLNENIFPSKPDIEFYKLVYWKAEYYIINEWDFNLKLFITLYKLRRICFLSGNLVPIASVFIKKIKRVLS